MIFLEGNTKQSFASLIQAKGLSEHFPQGGHADEKASICDPSETQS